MSMDMSMDMKKTLERFPIPQTSAERFVKEKISGKIYRILFFLHPGFFVYT